MNHRLSLLLFFIGGFAFWPITSTSLDTIQYWLKIRATDKFQRSVIADTGVAIQWVKEDFLMAIGNLQEKNRIEKLGWLESSYAVGGMQDFPVGDSDHHNYTELTNRLQELQQTYPQLVSLSSIGNSLEGRTIWAVRASGHLEQGSQLPAVVFLGGHHAREHLSVETPLRLLSWLLKE